MVSLWEQVETVIAALDVGRGRPRRLVEVMALYVTGLILLEKGQTAVRIAMVLPGRAHDALNRLLRVLPWSPHQLIRSLVRWVQRQTGPGCLCLDDVVVEKPFAKLLTWAGWTYSHSKQGHVFSFHVVLLFWCNKTLRIPSPSRQARLVDGPPFFIGRGGYEPAGMSLIAARFLRPICTYVR